MNHTKFLIEKIALFFELIRLRNCLIGLIGVIVAGAFINPYNELLGFPIISAGLSVFLIMGGGNTINDYFDYEIDRINRKNRPIPSGRINRSDTLMLSIILFLFGIAIAKTINSACFYLALINSLFLVLYGKYSKKIIWVSNFGVSYLVASIFIFGAISFGTQDITPEQVKILTILVSSAFFMTFSREITKDIEDVTGDRRNYAVTLPTKYGESRAKHLVIIFTFIAILISLIPILLSFSLLNIPIYGLFIGISDMLFLLSLTMHPSIAQRLMVVGMTIALLGFFIGRLSLLLLL